MNLITVLNIFYAVCFLPVLLILYITQRNEGKPKNNLILSTTLPKEAWEDERVVAIRSRYYWNLNLTCALLFLLYFPILLTDYLSIQITYLMVWLIAIIVVPYFPYCRAVKKMRALKKENWYHPELVQVQVADTSLASVYEEKQNTYTFVNFLLPLLVSMIPLLYPLVVPTEGSLFSLCLIILLNAATILLFYFCYRFMLRKKGERVNSDLNLAAVLTRIRRYYWGKFWLYSSWFCAVFSFSTLFMYHSNTFYLIFILIFSLALLGLALFLELKIRSEQQRLNREQPSEILADEDDYWRLGAFYYNKNDSNWLVNNRIGLGTTVNLAHPVGKGLTIFTILLLLSMPFLGIWCMDEEFTEPNVILTSDTLEAHHTKTEYTVVLNDILSCELLADLPSVSKNIGTNMPHLYKGSFAVKGIATNAQLCLDPYDELFLIVRTAKTCYIFSMEDSNELQRIYEEIYEKLTK